MRFLDHLTLGGEMGTMGIGLEVATPLRPNIRLRAGIMALPFTSVFADDSHQDLLKLVSAKGNSYDYMVMAALPFFVLSQHGGAKGKIASD